MTLYSAWGWLLYPKHVAVDQLQTKLCIELIYICFIY